MHALKDKVKIILKEVMNKVNSLTMIVDRCYTLQRREEDEDFILVYTLPNEMEEEDIEHIKELLVFFRQCELFIRYYMDVIIVILIQLLYFSDCKSHLFT